MAAPLGNSNRANQYRIKRTLEAVLEEHSRSESVDLLKEACKSVLLNAAAGDLGAFKEVADRLDGKPSQALDLGSDPDRPMVSKVVREIVRPKDPNG